MAKQIKQYRYYQDSSGSNYPENLTINDLISGAIFETNISNLKISTAPGTKFYLNQSTEPIIVGNNGVYRLNLFGNYEITALRFDSDNAIFQSSNLRSIPYLIIDIVYDSEE